MNQEPAGKFEDERSVLVNNLKKILKKHPVMEQLDSLRKKRFSDPYFPAYHFASPEGPMNDPNGICYWKGYWHLFYQAYPPESHCVHWGHAISSDLIHWHDLPYAIYPGPEQHCYSGSSLVEKNRVIAIYFGVNSGIMCATASDQFLLNWQKIKGGPVIPMDVLEKTTDLHSTIPFDPCIWKKNGFYYCLCNGRVPEGPDCKPVLSPFLFRSKDLSKWEYLHPFVEGDRFSLIGDDCACPYFWPIGTKYILLFFSHMSGTQAFIGNYDRKRDKFIITSHHRFNFGAPAPGGMIAPSATPWRNGNIIVIFNIFKGKSSDNQVMTIPVSLSLMAEDRLKIEPVDAVKTLRYNHQHIDNLQLPANREVILKEVRGNTMEIMAEIEIQNTQMLELNVLRSKNKEEFTRIIFFRTGGYPNRGRRTDLSDWHADSIICIDSSCSSMATDVLPRPPEKAPFVLTEKEPLKLRIFIDKSVVEVFVNNRQRVVARVNPSCKDALDVSLRSYGKPCLLKSLDAWQMRSIW